jgi:hypothetical protein
MLAVVGWLAVDFGLRLPGSKYVGLDPTTAHDAMVSLRYNHLHSLAIRFHSHWRAQRRVTVKGSL